MKVFIERENKEIDVKALSVSGILKELGINPETVLVVVNGSLAVEDKKLGEKDEVKVLSVVSGG